MELTVIVQSDVAAVLHERQPGTDAARREAQDLLRSAADLGVTLKAIHPGTVAPHLMAYFSVAVPDLATATTVINRFRQSAAVDSAYLKPTTEAP